LPLPPSKRTSHAVSPELVLVDRGLAELARDEDARHHPHSESRLRVVAPDAREAIRRMCELSDVNPPRVRRRRVLAFSGVLTLWMEAAFLLAAQLPIHVA
jgi:hypothetical protein